MLVSRMIASSKFCDTASDTRPGGEIGRHSGLKIRRTLIGPYRFDSGSGHQNFAQYPAQREVGPAIAPIRRGCNASTVLRFVWAPDNFIASANHCRR